MTDDDATNSKNSWQAKAVGGYVKISAIALIVLVGGAMLFCAVGLFIMFWRYTFPITGLAISLVSLNYLFGDGGQYRHLREKLKVEPIGKCVLGLFILLMIGLPFYPRTEWEKKLHKEWEAEQKYSDSLTKAREQNPASEKPRSEQQQSQPPQNAATIKGDQASSKEPDHKVTAIDLCWERDENELRFDSKYKGKLTLITGTVDHVGKSMMDGSFVTFKGAKGYEVTAYCKTTENKKLELLNSGQEIQLLGKCSGLFVTKIWFKDCQIVEPEKQGATHPKVTAFRTLVSKYKLYPKDPLASRTSLEPHIQEIEKIQRQFSEIPFDVRNNPDVAREMVNVFQAEVFRKYSGSHYNEFEAVMLEMASKLADR